MHKILIVDDFVDHLETLKMRLESAEFEVLAESDPKKVVKIAETEQPEVIMSDINMPGINGLELALLLKSNEKVKDIIILLFSGADQPGEMFRKALEAGANDYIRMPADKDEIISRINVCVERKKYIDELKKAEEELKKKIRDLEIFHKAAVGRELKMRELEIRKCLE